MFVPAPDGGLMIPDETFRLFCASLSEMGDAPINEMQYNMLVLLLTGARWDGVIAIGTAQAMEVLLREGPAGLRSYLEAEVINML